MDQFGSLGKFLESCTAKRPCGQKWLKFQKHDFLAQNMMLNKFLFFCIIVGPNLANLDAKFGNFFEIKITDTNVPKMSSRI